MYCVEEELPAAGAALLRRGGGSTRLPSRGCEDEDVLLCCAVVRCDAARPNPPRQLPAPLPGRPGDAGFGDRGAAPRVVGSVEPPRFYGATQFLGNFVDDDAHPHSRRGRRERRRQLRVRDDDDHVGFGYATVDGSKLKVTGMDVLDWFDIDQLPFFDHPFSTPVTPGHDSCVIFFVPIAAQFDLCMSEDDEWRQERSGCHVRR